MKNPPEKGTGRTTSPQRRRLLQALAGAGAAGFAGCLGDDGESGENGDGNGGNGNGENGDNGDGAPWEGYEPSGDPPGRVEPGPEGLAREPPGDATVLWNGSDATLGGWEHTDGSDPEWNQTAEYFEVVPGTGDLRPQEEIGDAHIHLEWRSPEEFAEIDGDGQWPGNSGFFLMETYEFQVLQSYENTTYPTGYAGAFYLANPEDDEGRNGSGPLVLPIRPPGEWNEYDIIWRGPRSEDGELVRRPQATLFFNGVAVQVHLDVEGASGFMQMSDFFDAHPLDENGDLQEEVPFSLQDHGAEEDVVHYRNVWYRELPEDPVEIADPDEMPKYDSDGIDWEDEAAEDDPDHPEHPNRIEPGGPGTTGEPPEDAEVVIDDELVLEPGDGDEEFGDHGDCQLHLEWQVPEDAEAEGPWRGDSGVMVGDYEIQILDNYENPTEPEEWAGAYTGEEPPHHDAVRESGEWQYLDLVFQGPRSDGPAQVTALLNGVAVQTRLQIDEPNVDDGYDDLALRLREPAENGSEVRFRNAWIRSLVDD